jgi:hypothetical protein
MRVSLAQIHQCDLGDSADSQFQAAEMDMIVRQAGGVCCAQSGEGPGDVVHRISLLMMTDTCADGQLHDDVSQAHAHRTLPNDLEVGTDSLTEGDPEDDSVAAGSRL